MKKHLSSLIIAVSLAVAVVCLFQIYELKNEVRYLQGNINGYMSNIQNDINNITYNIQRTIEREANLLSDSGWEANNWENVNITENKVTVECYVVPKEYSLENTKAYIYCNDTAFPMTLENGRFVTDVTMPIFTDSYIEKVQFEENGTIRTEKLDWWFTPKTDILPIFYANAGGYSIHYKDDFALLKYNGYVDLHVEHNGKGYERTAEFIVLVDGKEEWRKTIDLVSPVHSNKYADMYDIEISKDFEVKYGSTVETRVELKDSYGLTHSCPLENLTINNNDPDRSVSEALSGTADIYAPDGTPLYLQEWYE